MNVRTRTARPGLRLGTLALAVFGFATALTASAGFPNCGQCLNDYYACRNAGGDFDSCANPFWDCERANGCPLSFPPEI
ncbi:hypothetical protein ACI2IY_16720 [Lysobacter enzymogenes]|uniref:hypothetical protein n=1 Tax=Lysobacter enzymogenes TaxID=69 RepID=UPI00384A7130